MSTAAIYCRVSTEDQEREGSSLDSQKEACIKKAQELGYEVPQDFMFIETYSGLTLERPQLTRLRQAAKADEIKAVIVHTPDRLARVGEDILGLLKEFRISDVKILFVKEEWDDTHNGKLVAFVYGWASELEAEQIRERSMRGKRSRAKGGRISFGKGSKCFGYDYKEGKGQDEGIRHINEQEAEVVKNIYHWYVEERLTIYGVAYRLMAMEVPSPSGNRHWSSSSLHHILKNPAYIGRTFYNLQDESIEIHGATPPIISETLFNQAQAQLKRNRELAARNVKREYLLRGYVFCKNCGKRYQGAVKSYKTKAGIKGRMYYRCTDTSPLSPKRCSNPSWKADILERAVWERVEAVLSNPEVILAGLEAIEKETTQANAFEMELDHVNSRLKALESEQDQLLQWALKGFPKDTVERENEKLNNDREILKQRHTSLETKIKQAKESPVSIEGIKGACDIVKSNLAELSFENKRLALEALDIKVWLDDGITLEGSIPINHGAIVSTPLRRLQ